MSNEGKKAMLAAKKPSNLKGIGALLINQGINAIQSAISAISTIDSNNRSFMNTIASQSSTVPAVSGASSEDLIPDYNINLVEAYPREEIRKQIATVFHYTGYSHPVQEIPDFTSRY